MKRCSKCGIEKDDVVFAWRNKSKGTRNCQCDPCRKATAKRSYVRNKTTIIQKVADRKRENNLWYQEFKSTYACVICGEDTPACLDFHHVDPTKKDLDPSTAFAHSRQRFLNEIAKCVCLCATCHRKVHAGVLDILPDY